MSTILDDLTSGDAHRIWAGACAVATLHDEAELDLLCTQVPAIEKATQDIELGVMPVPKSINFYEKAVFYSSSLGVL